VQAAWARIIEPWVPFDRETVIGYTDAKMQQRGREYGEVTCAWEAAKQLLSR
jgi:hypothetical protein